MIAAGVRFATPARGKTMRSIRMRVFVTGAAAVAIGISALAPLRQGGRLETNGNDVANTEVAVEALVHTGSTPSSVEYATSSSGVWRSC